MGDLRNISVSMFCETYSTTDEEIVLGFLQFKEQRWERWDKNGGSVEDLLERTGNSDPFDVATVGFFENKDPASPPEPFEKIFTTVENLPLGVETIEGTMTEKEMKDLQKRFPFLLLCGNLDWD